MARVLMNAEAVAKATVKMADTLLSRHGDDPWAVIGIRRGGEPLGKRMAERMAEQLGREVPFGVVDITLYRDDGFGRTDWPEVGVTKLPFDLARHTVVLVDDVLYTGRTVRAALDAILDYGRPKAVRLAVLVDRGLRELPVAADVVGLQVETNPRQHVEVRFVEAGCDADAVVLTAVGAAVGEEGV